MLGVEFFGEEVRLVMDRMMLDSRSSAVTRGRWADLEVAEGLAAVSDRVDTHGRDGLFVFELAVDRACDPARLLV